MPWFPVNRAKSVKRWYGRMHKVRQVCCCSTAAARTCLIFATKTALPCAACYSAVRDVPALLVDEDAHLSVATSCRRPSLPPSPPLPVVNHRIPPLKGGTVLGIVVQAWHTSTRLLLIVPVSPLLRASQPPTSAGIGTIRKNTPVSPRVLFFSGWHITAPSGKACQETCQARQKVRCQR